MWNGTGDSEAGRNSCACGCLVHSAAESAYDSVRLFAVFGLAAWFSDAVRKFDGYSVDINYIIKNSNRFFDCGDRCRKEWLDKFFFALEDFAEEIPMNAIFYRLRNDSKLKDDIMINEHTTLKEISPQPCQCTKSYRMSPKGISYCYFSTDVKTCFEECNTIAGDRILIGIFKARRKLRILDLTIKKNIHIDLFSGDYDRSEESIRRFIFDYTSEISKSVDSNNEFDYLPTQVIAEYIRFKGYDGISYSSSKTKKMNYVFFYGPDYLSFPEMRPQGWNIYVDSVPRFLNAFSFEGAALCDVIDIDTHEVNIIKKTFNFNLCF